MYGNRVNSRVSSGTTGRRRWNKSSDDMGTCVCVYLGGRGGGVERVTYGLAVCVCMGAWGVYVGTEEISGIASRCSCPERETRRNRYMVHVFQVGGKNREKERLTSFFFSFAEKHPSCPNE